MFKLRHHDPALPADSLAAPKSEARGVLALDIQTKYQFVDDSGNIFHEYRVPGSSEIQNCGGYVDKIAKYRDTALMSHLRASGVSKASFASFGSPILTTRSPQLDLLLFELIRDLRRRSNGARISLFDHGCSAAEHFDLLDVMLQASGEGRARDLLSYVGLDISPLLLAAAKMLHSDVEPEHFRFVVAEGSALDFPSRAFDLSLSVGVVNHVADPPATIKHLLRGTRYAAVMALWVTAEEQGFHVLNNSGVSFYFFSKRDLASLQAANPDGRFLVADFIPERHSSQRSSYINMDAHREEALGCYHLVFTRLKNSPFNFEQLAL
jgi:Methyltransferase domain